MGKIKYPPPVKLIAGLISNDPGLVERAVEMLEERFGPIDQKTSPTPFDKTDYYSREMGTGLKRWFASFQELIQRDRLPEIKAETNGIEETLADPSTGNRRVNVDPGYISSENMILATTKCYDHRPYLGKGIYAEITYRYRGGSYRPLEWTYPDYKEEEKIALFNSLRRIYLDQLKKGA